MTETHVTLILGVLSVLGTIVVALISHRTKRETSAINDAVNNRHSRHPKLYDLARSNADSINNVRERVHSMGKKVDELADWKDSYKNSPWGTGDGVEQWLEEYRCEHCPAKGGSDDDADDES